MDDGDSQQERARAGAQEDASPLSDIVSTFISYEPPLTELGPEVNSPEDEKFRNVHTESIGPPAAALPVLSVFSIAFRGKQMAVSPGPMLV